jgi:hypothetical protein
MSFIGGASSACRIAGLFACALTLQACGGGGSGSTDVAASPAPGPAPAPAPAQALPTSRFLINGEGGIGTGTVDIDTAGNFTVDGTRISINAGGSSGCTFSSIPAEAGIVCNQLAGGKAFLLCQGSTGTNFDVGLFRQSDFTSVNNLAELGGATLTGLSCGATGPRTTSQTLAFSADGAIATQASGGSTSTLGAGIPAQLLQPGGSTDTGNQQRK